MADEGAELNSVLGSIRSSVAVAACSTSAPELALFFSVSRLL